MGQPALSHHCFLLIGRTSIAQKVESSPGVFFDHRMDDRLCLGIIVSLDDPCYGSNTDASIDAWTAPLLYPLPLRVADPLIKLPWLSCGETFPNSHVQE